MRKSTSNILPALHLIQREKKKRKLEDSLLEFTLWVFAEIYCKEFDKNWHHGEYCEILHAVHSGDLLRVLVNTPPRYTKTELFIIIFIAWCYIKNRQCNFLHTSYSIELVRRNSGGILKIICSAQFQELWPIEISVGEFGKTLWSTIDGGTMRSVNSGGAVTGFGAGAHLSVVKLLEMIFAGALMIDDPMKAGEERFERARNEINENFDEVLCTRLNGGVNTAVVIIMQRLHEDDLSGHVLSGKSVAGTFEHFCFPALKTSVSVHYDKRKKGEALWEAKHTKKHLEQMKNNKPLFFAKQMQQAPAPEEGIMIKREWIKYYTVRPTTFSSGIYYSVDLNAVEGGGSNACFSIYGVDNARIYLLDQKVDNWGYAEAEKMLKIFIGKNPYSGLLIEAKANGHAMISALMDQGYHGILAIRVDKNKEFRLNEVSPLYTAGNVYYPAPEIAPWIIDHEKEIFTFPNGKYDDRVDAETQMLKYFITNLHYTSFAIS